MYIDECIGFFIRFLDKAGTIAVKAIGVITGVAIVNSTPFLDVRFVIRLVALFLGGGSEVPVGHLTLSPRLSGIGFIGDRSVNR